MKVFKIFVGMLIIAASVVAINAATANASGNTCDIPKLKLGEPHGQQMVEKNGKITATFKITGKNCKTDVTLATWKSPSPNGQPINDQKLYHHTTRKNLGPGTHKITANLPNCYWQSDLLVGNKATAPDGTANYAYQNGKILKVHPLRDFKFGGKKKCEEPKPPKDVCPNLDGMQKKVPKGYMRDEDGNCVIIPKDKDVCPNLDDMQKELPEGYTWDENGNCVPVTEEQPEKGDEPQTLSTQTPEALPKTGAAAIATVFAGVSSLSAAAHAIFRKFLG